MASQRMQRDTAAEGSTGAASTVLARAWRSVGRCDAAALLGVAGSPAGAGPSRDSCSTWGRPRGIWLSGARRRARCVTRVPNMGASPLWRHCERAQEATRATCGPVVLAVGALSASAFQRRTTTNRAHRGADRRWRIHRSSECRGLGLRKAGAELAPSGVRGPASRDERRWHRWALRIGLRNGGPDALHGVERRRAVAVCRDNPPERLPRDPCAGHNGEPDRGDPLAEPGQVGRIQRGPVGQLPLRRHRPPHRSGSGRSRWSVGRVHHGTTSRSISIVTP